MPAVRSYSALIVAAILMFASSAAVRAAGPLTLDDAVTAAASSNPDLAASRERVRITELSRKAAASPFLPSVSVGASYDRSGGDNFSTAATYAVSASARQSLFAGGKDAATYHRRELELIAAQADLDTSRAGVSYSVKSAFARLLFAQDQLDLTRSIEKRRSENVRLVNLQYEGGRENKGSYLRSKANARQSSFDVAQAQRALRVAQVELLRATGRSQFETIQATGTLGALPPADMPNFHSLAADVPTVRSSVAGIEAARTDISFARGDFFPAIDASGSTGRAGADWPPKDDRWNVGVSASLPIFQGGSNVFGVKRARAALRQITDQSKSISDQAALDLETAYAAFADAGERSQVQQEFLQAAIVRAEIARSQYTSGLLSFNDWDIIENDLINTQKSHLSSLRDAAVAEADWERKQGKGAVQ